MKYDVDTDREQFQTELTLMDKRLKKEDSCLNDRIDNLSDYVRDVETKLDKIASKDHAFEGICMALVELAKIDIILMEGDEDDKRSISLMGVKETENHHSFSGQ